MWEIDTSGLVSACSGTHYGQGTPRGAVEPTKEDGDPGLTQHILPSTNWRVGQLLEGRAGRKEEEVGSQSGNAMQSRWLKHELDEPPHGGTHQFGRNGVLWDGGPH